MTQGWKPANYPSLSPYLICAEAEKLIAFLEAGFGGAVLRKFVRPDGSLMHAEVRIDDSVVMIGGGSTEQAPAPAHMHLYVPDVATSFDRAVAAGATIVSPPQRKSGDDLRAGVRDPSGGVWWLASQ